MVWAHITPKRQAAQRAFTHQPLGPVRLRLIKHGSVERKQQYESMEKRISTVDCRLNILVLTIGPSETHGQQTNVLCTTQTERERGMEKRHWSYGNGVDGPRAERYTRRCGRVNGVVAGATRLSSSSIVCRQSLSVAGIFGTPAASGRCPAHFPTDRAASLRHDTRYYDSSSVLELRGGRGGTEYYPDWFFRNCSIPLLVYFLFLEDLVGRLY